MMARHISTTDTAKLIRAALREVYPRIKFSIVSSSYSGGSSIRVRWMDGPTTRDVEAIAGRFAGASFDVMEDLKSYHESDLNGEEVQFGADYVFCNRDFSPEFLRRCAAQVARKYGVEEVQVVVNKYGGIDLHGGDEMIGNHTVRNRVMQEAYKTRF